VKIRFLAAACTALVLAVPASAQSSFVMIIGEMPTGRVAVASAPADQATLIEAAAERACYRPRLNNLKGQLLYRECLTEVRAEAQAQLAAGRQFAAR
jgi:hypothetical protein